jgi:hypothetical protein
LSALPRIRAVQNADHAVPAALQAAVEKLEAWRTEWRDALGLSGKRPKRVRPEASRLAEGRDALVVDLTAAERIASTAQARLQELAPQSAAPAEVRAAA